LRNLRIEKAEFTDMVWHPTAFAASAALSLGILIDSTTDGGREESHGAMAEQGLALSAAPEISATAISA
jgi:hypothetical protein